MSDEQLAAEDALRDMAAEGLDTDALRSFDRQDRAEYGKSWFAAQTVFNPKTGELVTDAVRYVADNMAEALGSAYLDATEDYPEEQGWNPPVLKFHPDPALVVGEGLVDTTQDEDDEDDQILGELDWIGVIDRDGDDWRLTERGMRAALLLAEQLDTRDVA